LCVCAIMAVSYAPFPSMRNGHEDTDDDVYPVHPRTTNTTWALSHRKAIVTVGLVIASIAMVATVLTGKASTIRADTGFLDAISQLSSEDPCENFEHIKIEAPFHNNLAGKGPDIGDEGIIYPAMNLHSQPPQALLLVVHATDGDGDTDPKANGIDGKYARLSAKGGTMIHLTFEFQNAETREPITLPEVDITFFDLDMHGLNSAVEYVRLIGFNEYFLTEQTEVDVKRGNDSYVTFKATTLGHATDNPTDPLLLTVQQKNRAVTVQYKDVQKFDVEIGAEGAHHQHRWFNFVLRPSLLCAKTVDCEVENTCGPPVTPAPSTSTTVVAGTETTTTKEERNCLFIIPIVNWCFPKFW